MSKHCEEHEELTLKPRDEFFVELKELVAFAVVVLVTRTRTV